MDIKKHLLRKSLKTGASVLLLVSSLLPSLSLITVNEAAAATTASPTTGAQQLAPSTYTNYDTGNHAYSNGEFNNTANYTTASTDGHTVTSGNWFNLVNDKGSSVGSAVFNGSLGTATSFSISAQTKIQVDYLNMTTSTNIADSGDAIGFVLTPSSASQLASNIASATGPNLGITGLANSYYLGRDLYSNLTSGSSQTGPDGTNNTNGWVTGAGDVIAIRSTTSTGALNAAQYPNLGTSSGASAYKSTTNGTAYMEAPESASYPLLSSASMTETIKVSWTPDTTNTAPAGYNSGTLSYSITTQSNNTYTLTTKANLQNSMSFGFLGDTGGYWSYLSVSLNNATGNAPRGTSNVLVNYINAVTGKAIASMPQSTIKANTFDTINVLSPSSTAGTSANGINTTYNFVAPAVPSGYSSFVSANSVTVQNFQAGSTNPNVINVKYQPSAATGHLYQAFSSGTPGSYTMAASDLQKLGSDFSGFTSSIGWAGQPSSGGTLVPGTAANSFSSNSPTDLASLSGTNAVVDGPISYPSLTAPAGYTMDAIYYHNSDGSWQTYSGSSGYTTLQSDHPNFASTNNTVIVTYKANTWTASFNAKFADNTPGMNGNSGQAPTNWSQSPVSGSQGAPFLGQTGASTSVSFTPDPGYSYTVTSTDGTNNYTDTSLAAAFAHWTTFNANTTFNVNITANAQKGTVSYSYVAGTPGTDNSGQPSTNPTTPGTAASLPANITLSGVTGDTVSISTANIPAGYSISYVIAPDGKQYSTIAAAQAASNTNQYLNPTANDWKIYLAAQVQSPTLTTKFTAAGSSITTPAEKTVNFQDASGNQWTGLTGTPIPSSIVTATSNAMNTLISSSGSTYNNWYISQYADPSGDVSSSTDESLQNVVTAAGGNVLGSSNAYTVQYNYQGVLSFSAPNNIDFGTHQITGTTQNLTATMDAGVSVQDGRATPSNNWTIEVAESTPLEDTANTAINFAGLMAFNGQTISSTPQLVFDSATQGNTNGSTLTSVLAANSKAFTLTAPINLQNANITYQGQLTWTLSTVPGN